MRNRSLPTFILLGTGIIAGSMDLAIVGPSLPGMVREFSLEPRSLSWVFTIYALFNLISLPMVTGLADRYGNQTVLRISIGLLMVSSLLTALSTSFWMVLLSRALTGLSVSGIFPVAPAIVPDHIAPHRRGRALGLIGASFGISLVAGPLLSGFMLGWFGWRSLFLLVAGLALVSFVFGLSMKRDDGKKDTVDIQWTSLLLLMLSIGSFAILLSGSGWTAGNWARYLPFIAAGSGIIFSILFIQRERKSKQRLFPRGITHNSLARLILLLGIGSGIIQACFIFLPHYLVDIFKMTDARASFLLVPLVAAFTLGNFGFGRLTDKIGPISVITLGWIMLGFAITIIGWSDHFRLFYVAGLLFGLGLSTLESPSLRYLLIHIPLEGFATRAQGLLSVFISLGQLSGSALLGSLASEEVSGDYQHAYRWILIFAGVALLVIWRLRHVMGVREQEQEQEQQ